MSNVFKVLKIARVQFENFQNITSDHKSRNEQACSYDFLFIIYSTKLFRLRIFFSKLFVLVFFSFWVYFSFSRLCLPNIQPGLCSFEHVFFSHFLQFVEYIIKSIISVKLNENISSLQ